MFSQHATQQENYSRQYTHHKHGTRQHFLEFPENRTESVVRQTATNLYKNQHQSSINPGKVEVHFFHFCDGNTRSFIEF